MTEPLMLVPPQALRASTVPERGHAARPGSGPEGETCGSCAHYTLRQMSKTYRIAGEIGTSWHEVARVARDIVIPAVRAPVPPEPTERERAGLAQLPAGHPIALAVLRDAWGMGR